MMDQRVGNKVVAGIVSVLATLPLGVVSAAAAEEGAHVDAANLSSAWSLPFAGLLLSIAVLPLLAPKLWHHHYGKIALLWALLLLAPFALLLGIEAALFELLHALLIEYVPFIVVLFALYTVSGGIFLEGKVRGTPLVNSSILAIGTMLASVTGTTGASVLLIRPLLRANAGRRVTMHVVIFFIFLVSNIGGSLSPLGDPPLYLGFLKGVDFFWPTTHLWPETLILAVILLGLFFVLDSFLGQRDDVSDVVQGQPVRLRGWLNVCLLVAVVTTVLGTSMWKTDVNLDIYGVGVPFPDVARTIALLGISALSLLTTPGAFRAGNNFTWGPIVEVAKLFAAIFVTIAPVIAMLKAGEAGAFSPLLALLTAPDGTANNAAYFWLTGGLSSFLDNAPTYLVFFNAAGGDPQHLMSEMPRTLAAISLGAVFMGANTYIGNAPNFMVKAIAEEAGVKMPSFFGYMLWSGIVLLPCFGLVTFVFFR